MSRILCTFPGRFGDLLWALPTIRAVSERWREPVDLLIAGEFAGLVPLLDMQPYLARVVADPAWSLSTGWEPPGREDVISPYARTYHLGYHAWPTRPLPQEVEACAQQGWLEGDGSPPVIDLRRPWISAPTSRLTFFEGRDQRRIALGWSECYFELKVGLTALMRESHSRWQLEGAMGGGRWVDEAGTTPCSWIEAAQTLHQAEVFFGDCSALHVLAVALGTPVILCEPMEARWNPIFYPLGMTGPQVTVVQGHDGRPTFDSRACATALEINLAR